MSGSTVTDKRTDVSFCTAAGEICGALRVLAEITSSGQEQVPRVVFVVRVTCGDVLFRLTGLTTIRGPGFQRPIRNISLTSIISSLLQVGPDADWHGICDTGILPALLLRDS